MTMNGNIGRKNMYCAHVFACIVVTGVIMPSKAKPVGRKRMIGVHMAAIFGSVKKFWTRIERDRCASAISNNAIKSWIAIPKST